MARNAAGEWEESPQELQVKPAPTADLDEILGPGEGAAQHQQQHFGKWVNHLPGLSRVPQGRKLIDQGLARCNRHDRLLAWEALNNHSAP